MSLCNSYDPDKVFKRFKVVEFPISCVGLWTSKLLDVEINLNKCAYIKTMCNGTLQKFEDAREISPSHRAFLINQVDDHTLQIIFNPTNECICNPRYKKKLENKFVFDLRLFQIDGLRCCNNEFHSEIGRYYICGQYEYCKVAHFPKIIDFGDVIIESKTTKYVGIRNESNIIPAKFDYIRVTGFEVVPPSFTVSPNSCFRIAITIKPTALKIKDTLIFHVRNPYDIFDASDLSSDDNYLPYTITCKSNIIYNKKPIPKIIESLHKINERSSAYTYISKNEKEIIRHRKEIAEKQMQYSKLKHFKKPIIEKFSSGRDRCYDNISLKISKLPKNFCKKVRSRIDTYGLFDIIFLPFTLNFGNIALHSYGEKELTIKNNTTYDVTIEFYQRDCVLYTEQKVSNFKTKIKSMNEMNLTIFCLGYSEGIQSGILEYSVDKKYYRKHSFLLQVGNPTLILNEKALKFGMTTSESFITSVPVKIFNHFNIPVDFTWRGINAEMPFKIIPDTGSVSQHSCKVCDIIYLSKPIKTKTHEIEFVSQGQLEVSAPLELNIITRKLSIKFLQLNLVFKDVSLNIETVQYVKLENSSREMAVYYVVEPLLPGISVKPMHGNIRPKMIITFQIVVKISCVLEFNFDFCVKINNKETIILPVSGNVMEPKILVHPKNISMPRVPCHLVTYVPITFQNLSLLRTEIDIIDTGDDNIFNVYVAHGNEKLRIFHFSLEGGQSKQLFIKVTDIFRREYEMFIPIKINGLIGPPDSSNSWSTDLHNYIMKFEEQYENNPKVKIKSVTKDICYCHLTGVITVPWIEFSVDNFEINYEVNGTNKIDFTITNVSKYYLYITILTSKLAPSFTLNLTTEDNQSIINETNIKFELDSQKVATFSLKFHPKGHGRFVSTATLFLDKHMTTPYHNLTFIGKRQAPLMTPDTFRIIFPPCYIGTELCRRITLKLETISDLDAFSCMSKEEPNMTIKFLKTELVIDDDEISTILTVEIRVCCVKCYGRSILVSFHHETGSCCEIEISFCYTHCPLTLHINFLVQIENNPYPYFPSPKCQKELYEYMVTCTKFLEKWMFQQGFRRDLFPVIPDTFHGISASLSTHTIAAAKTKGINVSYLNFIRRIAGPLMKHIHRMTANVIDESFRQVKEIYDTYREILRLIKSRGVNLWVLQPRFLLSYDQFIIYSEHVTSKSNADILLTQELLNDVNLFNRLSKQSWIDFILQSYKVFVMDSCFFECVCVNSKNRDIVNVLISWYNDHIAFQHKKLRGQSRPLKLITNLTTDLSDGVALISTIISYCPFLTEHFALYCEVEEDSSRMGAIINNACLIIEAMNQLRLFFPLSSEELLRPNFLQMLFLSIHLYVTLPMFNVKDTIKFSPPLLRTSTRLLSVFPSSQENLTFNHIILNNVKNCFSVEKAPAGENGKKMYLSVNYVGNFVSEDECILLVHGYNKTRIFDTYVVFILQGKIGTLTPFRKSRITGPLYRPVKVDILVASPFPTTAIFNIYLTDTEPTIPVDFTRDNKPKFYLQRLNLIEEEITLVAAPKENAQDMIEHKLYLQMICLSTLIGSTWVWFRSDIGDFFIKITTQPRWDLATDTLQAKVHSWPIDPCSCGESCECYRTTNLMIPHRNELMLKALRYALIEHTSESMMQVFDDLIETNTGKIILRLLLMEGGTNMADVNHILQEYIEYRVTSKNLLPRLDRVRLAHHTQAMLSLPVTVPAQDKSEKYSVIFTSECGSEIRTYKILFIESMDECGC